MKGIKLAKSVLIGAVGAMLVGLILSMLLAALVHGGVVPMGGIERMGPGALRCLRGLRRVFWRLEFRDKCGFPWRWQQAEFICCWRWCCGG